MIRPELPSDDDRLLTRYLLGSTPQDDTERLDELSIIDHEFASRLRSVEDDLIDAYVRGELKGETLLRFESLYLTSPSGVEKIQFAKSLQKQMTRSQASTAPVHVTARAPRIRSGRERTLLWSLAGVAAALLVLSGFLFQEVRRMNTQLASERARARELAQMRQSAATADSKHSRRPRQGSGRAVLTGIRFVPANQGQRIHSLH